MSQVHVSNDDSVTDLRSTRHQSLAELLQRSLEDDTVGPDDQIERNRWDDDEGSSGG